MVRWVWEECDCIFQNDENHLTMIFPVQATFVPSAPHPQFDVVELTKTCEDKLADRIRTHATNNLVGLL